MEIINESDFTGYSLDEGLTGLLWDEQEQKFQVLVKGQYVGNIFIEENTITVADKDFRRAFAFEDDKT